MARVIQEHIKRPLAEELLFGKLSGGGHVRIEVAEDGTGLVLTCEPEIRELEHLPEGSDTNPSGAKPRRSKADGNSARVGGRDIADGELADQQDGGSEG
jgi:ATP-dependent Clp protease ATP-binding subunit ClpA